MVGEINQQRGVPSWESIPLNMQDSSETALSVTMANIGNAQDPDYIKQRIEAVPIGVDGGILGMKVTTKAYDYLNQTAWRFNAEAEKLQQLQQTHESLMVVAGLPKEENSLGQHIEKLQADMELLAQDGSNPHLRNNVLQGFRDVSDKLNEVYGKILELQQDADQQIEGAVKEINYALSEIARLNDPKNDQINSEQRHRHIKTLAKYFDISTNQREGNQIAVHTKSGIELIDPNPAVLTYTSQSKGHPSQSYANGDLNGIQINGIDVTHLIRGGKAKAFFEIRDSEASLLGTRQQLDELASSLDDINAMHNKGTGYPPQGRLTSGFDVDDTTAFAGVGTVRIAAVDKSSLDAKRDTTVNYVDIDLTGIATVGDLRAAINANGNGNTRAGSDFNAEIIDGKLVIKTNNEASFGIAIGGTGDGITFDTPADIPTNKSDKQRGFSHAFALNNVFKLQTSDLAPSAAFNIRIVDHFNTPGGSQHMSIGALEMGAVTIDETIGVTKEGLQMADGQKFLEAFTDVFKSDHSYVRAGNLGDSETNFAGRACQILEDCASMTKKFATEAKQAELAKIKVDAKISQYQGVNTKQEYQNANLYALQHMIAQRLAEISNKLRMNVVNQAARAA